MGYRSVGVITEQDREGWGGSHFAHWMKKGSTANDNGKLYFQGHRNNWQIGEIITVELDYGNGTMAIYRTPSDTSKRKEVSRMQDKTRRIVLLWTSTLRKSIQRRVRCHC